MSFYDLSKEQRSNLVDEILKTIFSLTIIFYFLQN
jgi:hypothetical protein